MQGKSDQQQGSIKNAGKLKRALALLHFPFLMRPGMFESCCARPFKSRTANHLCDSSPFWRLRGLPDCTVHTA